MSPRTPVPADARFTVPNIVTVLRILMAVLAAVCFATGRALELAVFLCIAAALLDIFDGWYARAFSQCSHLGEHLDPLADKLLMAVVYGVIAVAMDSQVIWVLTGLIALREVAMTTFRSYSLRRHQRFIPANRLGKVKMILQSTVGLAILAYAYLINGGFELRESSVAVPMLVILFVSWFSAVVYVRNWNAARSAHRKRVATVAVKGPVNGFEDTNRMVVGK